MKAMIARRLLSLIPTLLAITFLTFVIINLPPGDYLTSKIAALEESGDEVSLDQIEALRLRYHLDDPFLVRYGYWMAGLLRGDLGVSFEWNKPVTKLIGSRLALTVTISLCSLLMTWALAIPIGIYSAVRQHSWGDYAFTFIGFVGLATPNFLLALLCMYVGYTVFGISAGGLFSPEYQNAPWSLAKFMDFLAHVWIPVLVVGSSGTAGLIRILRANLLDELRKQYVLTARAKGLHHIVLLLKYPVRVALNPLLSTIGGVLPGLVSGATITAMVLGLPTVGPLLLQALQNQDMYLAGSMVLMLSFLSVIGTLISDLLLMWNDPRIRMEGAA